MRYDEGIGEGAMLRFSQKRHGLPYNAVGDRPPLTKAVTLLPLLQRQQRGNRRGHNETLALTKRSLKSPSSDLEKNKHSTAIGYEQLLEDKQGVCVQNPQLLAHRRTLLFAHHNLPRIRRRTADTSHNTLCGSKTPFSYSQKFQRLKPHSENPAGKA